MFKMALYAIGDLHLSEATEKPMDIFGGRWENYTEKLKTGFSVLQPEDICVICGDISWAMNLNGATADFQFIQTLPGKKIILKGNHDFWWTTRAKVQGHLDAHGISGIDFLHNNHFCYDDIAICGTRGWFYEEEKGGERDKKVMMREITRLETSLKSAGDLTKYVFLHYPPIYGQYVCEEILDLFSAYDVKLCCYGHIHGKSCAVAFEGERDGVLYRLVSADHVFFQPQKITDLLQSTGDKSS